MCVRDTGEHLGSLIGAFTNDPITFLTLVIVGREGSIRQMVHSLSAANIFVCLAGLGPPFEIGRE